MTGLIAFAFEGHRVRTVEMDGSTWFVAGDIATVLEYRMASDMTRRLDEADTGYAIVSTPGGDQRMTVINESGMYDAVYRSNATGARAFRQWVTSEVLPQIRRTGSFGEIQPRRELSRLELIDIARDAELERIEAVKAKEQAEALVLELEAPAAAWEGLASAQGDYTVSDAAKILGRAGVGTGPRKLFDYLRDDARWVFRRGDRWQAMQTAVNAGLVVERITGGYFDDVTGERKQGKPQVRVTPKGIERLLTLMSGNVSMLQTGTDR
ncbi:phage antirepressor KilAC domain-containing protein [Nocardioides jensenii]|uniref:phage antirepressor KilAC domain-containing protein n=1 Tax=Nocardioides jensenii TaxID=1843 RepID=UPI00082D3C29|nr:phage antirepressor KilAC domain-containing protein [Nocardioides jensenii]